MKESKFTSTLQQRLDKIAKMPKVVTGELFPFVVSITPIDKGNAREHTRYNNDTTIHADYDYAERLLHQGWSKQLAANTFDDKVKKFVDQRIKEYMRKL
jgi:hypothetical protein